MAHELQLVDSLSLAALVLEPDLDDPHGQPGLLGQLLTHQARGLWVLVEAGLQHLQLLGLDGGAGAATLAVLALLLVIVLVLVILLVGASSRKFSVLLKAFILFIAELLDVIRRNFTLDPGIGVAIRLGFDFVVDYLTDVVLLAEEVAQVVQSHLHATLQGNITLGALEAVEVEP